MALSGTFTSSTESVGINGLLGNCDVFVTYLPGAKGSVYLDKSIDGGANYKPMIGGDFGYKDIDTIMVAGDSTIYYRFRCSWGAGSIEYYLGNG